MTGRAIDKALLGFQVKILHFYQLVIDHLVHDGHLSGGSFRPFVVAGEVLFYVTVRTCYAECPAVSEIHDSEKSCCRSVLQPWYLYVLKYSLGGLVLPTRNLVG